MTLRKFCVIFNGTSKNGGEKMREKILSGDKVLRDGRRKIIVRIIKEPSPFCGESTPSIFSSALVYFGLNWKLPLAGEVNENSCHPLSQIFRFFGLSSFSIMEDSVLLEIPIGKDPLEVGEKVAQFIFKYERISSLKSKGP